VQLITLIILGSVIAFDAAGGRALLQVTDTPLPTALVVALTLGPMGVVLFVQWWVTVRCGRKLDQTGRGVYVQAAQRISRLSRWGIALVHTAAVFVLGTPNAVRDVVGDPVLIDELLTIAPALGGFSLSWALYFGIERRLRDAEVLRLLDRGAPVRHMPGLCGYVTDQFRHQVLIVLVPILAIIAWREILGRAVAWSLKKEYVGAQLAGNVAVALEFAGVILILLLMPFVLRHVWRTIPLRDGPLRDRLAAMCERAGIGCRDLLVWVTHGMMINGAVVGLVGRARYILLTDGLLEEMEEREVEAVMAHEIAHVVCRHILWLMGSLIVTTVLAGAVFSYGANALMPERNTEAAIMAMESVAVVFSIGIGLFVFGFVSRRFERQADAFAVRMLAQETADEPGNAANTRMIREEDSRVMIDALGRVAQLNHIPVNQFMWRHGSIRSRQRALARLVGRKHDEFAIDRIARRIKTAIFAGGVLAAILLALGV